MSLFTAVYGVECEDCGEQIWSHDWINEAGAMRGACSAGWTVNEEYPDYYYCPECSMLGKETP